VVGRLTPSPLDGNIRICDECLAVCYSILSDVDQSPGPPAHGGPLGHCRMCDPRTPELLDTIEQWVIAESQNRPSPVFLGRACRLALSMMGLDSA